MSEQLDRYYFMDSMRAVLMMLGVVIHSAQIFNPEQSWLIGSDKTSLASSYVVEFITTFRMPAFFVVSGFFCFLTINKYKPRKFISLRLRRILIPLISTALILNSLQTIVLIKSGWLHTDWQTYLTKGGYISHLWFLTNLVAYFLFAFVVSTTFKKHLIKLHQLINDWQDKIPFLAVMFLLPTASILVMATNKIGFPLYTSLFGVFNIYSICIYLPYFIFGIILGSNKELLRKFVTLNPLINISVITTAILVPIWFPLSEGPLSEISKTYLAHLTYWASVSLCFYLFFNLFNKPSEIWLYLSDASYTVYLFHHILVICIGLILVNLGFPPIITMGIIIVSTILLTLIIHNYLVLKIKPAKFLFNGK